MSYPVLLPRIRIETGNRSIRLIEGATTQNVNIVAGDYYLRGDDALDDFCRALRIALNSHPGSNTYTVVPVFLIDVTSASAGVSIIRATGSDDFQISFAHSTTTFDAATIGFPQTNTLLDALTKVSEFSPWACWVGADIYRSFEAVDERSAARYRARSGKVRGVKRSETFETRMFVFENQHINRVWPFERPTDFFAAFRHFLDTVADGRPFEFHDLAVSIGDALVDAAASTRIGDRWHTDEDAAMKFEPIRAEPGLALYAWSTRVLGFVE